MHTYNMLADGDRILIAVSGGIDSLVLAALLQNWQKKAPIHYSISAIHIDMGFNNSKIIPSLKKQFARMKLPLEIAWTNFGKSAVTLNKSGCFHCARNRRTHLFSLAREKNYNKLALGHHQEDIIETFFINLLYGGNISTMVPNQPLFNGNLTVIRPLSFLDKKQVTDLGNCFDLKATDNPCPLSGTTKRETVRQFLGELYNNNNKIKANIFAALGNVKTDYLL
jgi:tRNA 2-thiocytidine biosynthesis protein TtcA